jgi:hypothetical protein
VLLVPRHLLEVHLAVPGHPQPVAPVDVAGWEDVHLLAVVLGTELLRDGEWEVEVRDLSEARVVIKPHTSTPS